MNLAYWQRAAFLFLLASYGLLFYFILTFQQGIDFASFYSASQMLAMGDNPYQTLVATYLPVVKKLACNLNPPIVLILFNPLVQLNYHTALVIWWLVSLILSLVSARLVFKLVFSPDFYQQNWPNLYLLYLAFFGILMDRAIAQLGALLLFCILFGYHFYVKKNDCLAGILWGFIIALKFFPAMLFFYVLLQKRYKTFLIMSTVTLLLCILPILLYGMTIYQQYFSMMSQIRWYGDNWNASIYGYFFRIFIDTNNKTQSHIFVNTLYGLSFIVLLLWYLKTAIKMQANAMDKHFFALSLAMMLLLSPFGWLYYFSLLIFPLCLTWETLFLHGYNFKHNILWLLSLFLLNFPIDYLSSKKMTELTNKFFIYSFYFYGLLLLIFLLSHQRTQITRSRHALTNSRYVPVIAIIFIFGFLVPVLSFLERLFDLPFLRISD
ncbi:glycosyltransferase family 87 protein [Legionella hackeliae]|uniref:Putative integral membrane protein n=1 Tax=Legionella hackeliae TaxID=449 RepID=A0A0A8UPR7_LEGHA|nr:glycosyltransferase family 87 protein [Legionella hackeliae]KTD14868.1 hypothetical protein Lhac_0398 [Legionella hackeliae]CEK09506.1 putative integral membrane protein [Legionella hackeliae]STX49413.1 Protein of uncharacterised function (DUF2029) [Legionella hackeliae]